MITSISATSYGPLRDVTTPTLGALHAFIGPNDSGKSSLLRAVRVGVQLAGGSFAASDSARVPFDPLVTGPSAITLRVSERDSYTARFDPSGRVAEDIFVAPVDASSRVRDSWTMPGLLQARPSYGALDLLRRPAQLIRYSPDDLRRPSALAAGAPPHFENERGLGLGGALDRLRDRDEGAYERVRDSVLRRFPSASRLAFDTFGEGKKSVSLVLRDGTKIPSSSVSEGFLYFLAFSVLQTFDAPSVFLIEEPENGLHPSRIADVMDVLRAVSKTTQVLIATHSPLVVNELAAEEVSIVTRTRDSGTVVRAIKDTPNFAERSDVYRLGELWVSYANGIDEAPLFTENEPVPDPGDEVEWGDAGRVP